MAHRPLIIFDCDGVLVDSEPISNRCFATALNRAGLDWTVEETTRRLAGRAMADCVAIAEAALGRALPAGFAGRLAADTERALRAEPVRAVAFVEDAIEALTASGCEICVASSGAPEKMRLSLGITGLLPRFEGRLFSATMVARGKPAPDLFLHAARAMGAVAPHCVVVEDSIPGVQAGLASGMRVLAYAGGAGADRAALAAAGGEVFADMRDLPALFGIAG